MYITRFVCTWSYYQVQIYTILNILTNIQISTNLPLWQWICQSIFIIFLIYALSLSWCYIFRCMHILIIIYNSWIKHFILFSYPFFLNNDFHYIFHFNITSHIFLIFSISLPYCFISLILFSTYLYPYFSGDFFLK